MVRRKIVTPTGGVVASANGGSTTCARPGCRKPVCIGTQGDTSRSVLCVAHSRPSEPCAHKGCGRKASHGVKGTRMQELCIEHATEGMVNLRSKRCGHPRCFKIPTYGLEGSKIRDFCAPHAKLGMVNINSTKCIHVGCNVEASFGVRGDGRRLLCSKHFNNKGGGGNPRNKSARRGEDTPISPQGSVAVEAGEEEGYISRPHRSTAKATFLPCAHRGCSHRRTHGVKGTATPELCREHAEKGMVDLVILRCDSKGCSKLAKFGMPNSWERGFCSHHAGPGMIKGGTTAVHPDEATGAPGRKRKRLSHAPNLDSSSTEGDVADQPSTSVRASSVLTRAKAEQERRAVEPRAQRGRPRSESPSPTRQQKAGKAQAQTLKVAPPGDWPGTALLQTPTGWSIWKWPSSLSRVAT